MVMLLGNRYAGGGLLVLVATLVLAAGCEAASEGEGRKQAAGGASGTGTGGEGGAVPCTAPEQCPGTDGQCGKRTCLDGRCGVEYLPADTECSGPPGGKVCDGFGHCVECNATGQCKQGVCWSGQCVPVHCADGAKNGSETDVDCGGGCPACADGKKCKLAADCTSGFCEGGKCKKRPNGEPCAAPAECQSGHCTDGLCCDKACAGPCEACSHELGASDDGACTPLVKDTVCRGAAGPCDAVEICDGAGGECPADALVPDGQPSAGDKCTPYQCDGEKPACPSACAGDGDCAAGYACKGGLCLKAGGQACGGAGECASGFCADGVCCDEACAGLCRACSAAKTGGKDGACAPVTAGTDPDAECAPAVCDGAGACAKGMHLWSKRFGDASDQYGRAVAVDGSGNMFVTGWFEGTVDFGGGPLASSGQDVFVAKLDKDGKHLWSKHFAGAGSGITTDGSGAVLVAAKFAGTVDLGGGPLTSAGDWDIFVAKLDKDGQHLWSKRFGDATSQSGIGDLQVAADAAGNVLVTGNFAGTVDFGGGPLVAAGYEDLFLAAFDTSGQHLWSKRFGDASMLIPDSVAESVAADVSGNVFVTGSISSSTLNFGGQDLTSAGGSDAFVAKFDKGGSHLWSKRFGDGASQMARGVAVDASGNALMTGFFAGSLDFGGGPLASSGGDVFVAKLDKDGKHLWSKRFGAIALGRSIAVDAAGDAVLTGYFDGTVDFGGGALVSAGPYDIFVAKLGPDGKHLWSRRFGDASDQVGWSIAADASGNALVTGWFDGTVDFGGGPLASAGGADIFLAKFSP
ncbi:MAG: SBBP repeat-containing protein [Deltaproteobacteria bacterium]|nr:SBBP repeat-containing protein [Deltaproteobacteria bacterium]